MNQHEGAIARFKRIFFSNTKLSKRNRDNVLSMGVNSFGYTFFEEIVTSYMQFFYTEFMMLEAAIVSGVRAAAHAIASSTDEGSAGVSDSSLAAVSAASISSCALTGSASAGSICRVNRAFSP